MLILLIENEEKKIFSCHFLVVLISLSIVLYVCVCIYLYFPLCLFVCLLINKRKKTTHLTSQQILLLAYMLAFKWLLFFLL